MVEKRVVNKGPAAFADAGPNGKKAKRAKGGPILTAFRFLGSLELAVTVLMVLGCVLAGAMFVEAAWDTEFVLWNIYHSQWFIALLGLLAGNVLAAMLLRWPWKIRHTGFLMIHLGLLTLLAGALLDFRSGVEGQVTLLEGQTADTMLLTYRSRITLTWSEGDDRKERVFTFAPGPTDWSGDKPLDFGQKDGVGVRVIGFYRRAVVERSEAGRFKFSSADDPYSDDGKKLDAAVNCEITVDGKPTRLWIRRGYIRSFNTDRGPMEIDFGYASYPLGFSLTLTEATLGVNPGGSAMGDASYASEVRLVDESTDPTTTLNKEISMNTPLIYGKFTLYQSGFEAKKLEDGLDRSTLSVAHDSGSFLKYLGSLLLCLGTFVVFYLQRFLTKLGSSRDSGDRADSLATSESV